MPRVPHGGVTLVELLVTIAVAAIVLTLGTAGFTRLVAEGRMATAVNSFVTDLQLARSESIKRGVDVTVCVSSGEDIGSCDAGVDQWNKRYVIIADKDGARQQLLRVQTGKAQVMVAGTASSLTYHPDGSAQNTQFDFSDAGGRANCRRVTVSAIGYLRTDKADGPICP